jgi:hypothetical protein
MRSPFISAVVAGSLLMSTTTASAQTGPMPLRSGAEVEEADGIAGTFMIIGLIVVLAVIAGVILLDDDDEPSSP